MLRRIAGRRIRRAAARPPKGPCQMAATALEKRSMSTTDTTSSMSLNRRPQLPADSTEPKAPAVLKPAQKRRRPPVWLLVVACVIAAGGAGAWYWWQQHLNALPPGIAQANGRLEAEQVEISAKLAGRIAAVLVKEGDMVHAGQVLARMDTSTLEAELAAAKAQVAVNEHKKAEAEAQIVQQQSNLVFAGQELARATTLYHQGYGTGERLDQQTNQMKSTQASLDTAIASLEAAKASIAAAQAVAATIQSNIDDSTLVAPTEGRIQYKLAQPGEVLAAGGRVLTLLDLSDVYLTIFVPASVAGPLHIGDDARVTLDPDPGYVFPAKVTFVATEAQFTPKTVETAEEREKLMFRVKLSAAPELRKRYEDVIKTGVRGIGFVRSGPDVAWPAKLAVKLP
jgi:HlyD family secretion protein